MPYNETSLLPWVNAIYANLGERQREVLEFIERCGDFGSTSEEAVNGLNRKINCISGRFSELKAKNRIIWACKRKTSSGHMADVYIINKKYIPEVEIELKQEFSGQLSFAL